MRSTRFQILNRVWDYLFDDWSTRLAKLGLGRRAVASRKIPLGWRLSRLTLETLEDRITPDGRPLPLPFVFVGSASGAPPIVRAYHADTGELAYERTPFDAGFTGGVRVAAGDIDHDGIPDLIAAAGPGGGPRVRVYSGADGSELRSFYAYDPAFTGGVYVASGDVDGDGTADIITAAGAGGGPHIKIFSGKTGLLLDSFYAFDPAFRGGATVAAADFTGDGKADLVVGAGAGAGPHVVVLDLNTGDRLPAPLGSFFAFDPSFRGGVDVGTDFLAGDVTADGAPDIVVGRGAGAGSLVRVFDGRTGTRVREFSPFGTAMTAGVRVSTAFVDDDRYADVIVGSGAGPTSSVKVFSGRTGLELAAPMSSYTPFGAGYAGGVFVAGSNDPPTGYVYTNASSPTPTITVNQPYTLIVDVRDPMGTRTPTGTIAARMDLNGQLLGWALLAAVGPGYARATVTVPPNSFQPRTYSTDYPPPIVWEYSGDAVFQSAGGYAPPLTVTGPPPGPPGGDLDIIDSNGAEVAEAKEENPGGWVPINNDNYNFVGDANTSIDQNLDKDENGKVVGENDLVAITIHDLVPAGAGQFILTGWGPRIKIWRTNDKVGAVPLGTVFSPGQPIQLWVEGILSSNAPRDEEIWLAWWPTGGSSVLVDRVKFTVYEVRGAMNVPEHARYTYGAAVWGGEPRFESVTGVQNLAQSPMIWGPSPYAPTRFADILWDSGPTVGVYRVYPTAANNFFVNRQVNVVKVEIAAAGNSVDYKQTPRQTVVPDGVRIASATPANEESPTEADAAMLARLRVSRIEGPTVSGAMRGVRFIGMGMIQDGRNTQLHADYNGFNPGLRRVSSLESNEFGLDAADAASAPWYYSIFPGFFNSPTDVLVNDKDFTINDTPSVNATDSITLTSGGVTDKADRFAIVADFRLYFAVRTRETSLDSDLVYTQRGCVDWQFDGSGTITAAGIWTGTKVKPNTGGAAFTVVTDGSVVPITTGTPLNDRPEVWSTVNQ